METSPTITKLAAALVAAQGELKAATLDAENPHFRSRYATLAGLWDTARPTLAKHGLAVSQLPEREEGAVGVMTLLIHTSGEWMSSRLMLPLAQQTAQAVGSALTYARRYALASVVGLTADEDDDGNEASKTPPHQAQTPATGLYAGRLMDDSDQLTGTVSEVREATGEKAGKPWHRWNVRLVDARGMTREAVTFNDVQGKTAITAKDTGATVQMSIVRSGTSAGSWKIKTIEIV
ncbi:MAG: ERF family protein [Chthoniobacterales bacterium]